MGIISASNKAFAASSGKYITFMDHDDLLFPDALLEIVRHLNGIDADILYSDEIKFDPSSQFIELVKKRDFSLRALLLAHFMVHLTIIKRDMIESDQLFSPGFDFSQDFELALRLSEKTDKIVHIKRCLYAWRIHSGSTAVDSRQKMEIYTSAKKAISASLKRQGMDATVKDGKHLGQYVINIDKVKSDPSRTINFILPGIGLGGGARVVFQLANKLRMMGFHTNIIFPKTPYHFTELDTKKNSSSHVNMDVQQLLVSDLNYFDLRTNLIQVPSIDDKFIPDAIATVATAWPTAYSVNWLDDRKGKKFYFIQHYEVWQGPTDAVNESYKLGLGNIVIANWLQEKMKEIGGNVAGKVTVPFDTSMFFPYHNKKEGSELRLLLPYRPEHTWKGAQDGIEAFKKVKQRCPQIKLVTYGPSGSLLDEIQGKKPPTLLDSDLRDIYNSCDIMIFPSWTEGNPLPPMEGMACGLALCTTNCTGIDEFAKNDFNALISPIKSPSEMADNLERVIKDAVLRKTLSENAMKSIRNRTPERLAKDFLQVTGIK